MSYVNTGEIPRYDVIENLVNNTFVYGEPDENVYHLIYDHHRVDLVYPLILSKMTFCERGSPLAVRMGRHVSRNTF